MPNTYFAKKKRGKLRPSPEKSIRFEQGGEVYPKRMEIAAEHGAVSSKSALVKVNCLKGGMRTLPLATPRRLLKEDTGQAGEIEPSIASSIHKYKYTNTEDNGQTPVFLLKASSFLAA